MKESGYRALRTFVQVFLGYIAANILAVINGVDLTTAEGSKYLLYNLIIPAIATALAAIMNYTKKPTDVSKTEDTNNEVITETTEEDIDNM